MKEESDRYWESDRRWKTRTESSRKGQNLEERGTEFEKRDKIYRQGGRTWKARGMVHLEGKTHSISGRQEGQPIWMTRGTVYLETKGTVYIWKARGKES